MNDLFSEDFDLTIQEVKLAHQYLYYEKTDSALHLAGRKSAGIVYCISGCADYVMTDSTFRLNAGELVFLPEGMAYRVRCPENFLHITVNFHLLHSDFLSRVSHFQGMVVQDEFRGDEILRQVVSLWGNKKTGYRVQVKSLLYELLYQYFNSLRKQSRTPEYRKLRPAKKLLDTCYHQDIPVADLAAACGFSETHFRRLFCQEFHCSPVEYRLEKRLLQARDLLLAGELSVSQISAEVGFSDANYFSRVFKQRFGVSPTMFSR